MEITGATLIRHALATRPSGNLGRRPIGGLPEVTGVLVTPKKPGRFAKSPDSQIGCNIINPKRQTKDLAKYC